jgi:hypothetical protein
MGGEKIQGNGMEVEMWQQRLNVAKHYREHLKTTAGAQSLCQLVKYGAMDRQETVAMYGPHATCNGRHHAPGVKCYYCMSYLDEGQLKLKNEIGMRCSFCCSRIS